MADEELMEERDDCDQENNNDEGGGRAGRLFQVDFHSILNIFVLKRLSKSGEKMESSVNVVLGRGQRYLRHLPSVRDGCLFTMPGG